jgi:hypothetical protein
MPSWGFENKPEDQPKWIQRQRLPAGTTVLLLDSRSATLSENRAKGLRSPGWWLYRSWTDGQGRQRHASELLVAFAGTYVMPTITPVEDTTSTHATLINESSGTGDATSSKKTSKTNKTVDITHSSD